jgi:hypothetical protein
MNKINKNFKKFIIIEAWEEGQTGRYFAPGSGSMTYIFQFSFSAFVYLLTYSLCIQLTYIPPSENNHISFQHIV